MLRQRKLVPAQATLATVPPSVRFSLPCNSELTRKLRGRVEQIAEFSQVLSAHFPYLEVEYESFFPTGVKEAPGIVPDVLQQIYQFLEVSDRSLAPESYTVKQGPSDLRDTIENYDEVKAFLSTQGLSSFLEC